MSNPIFNFFGFQIKRSEEEKQLPKSVVAPNLADGSIVINQNLGTGILGDSYTLAFDPDGQITNEIDLVRRYRELCRYPEVAEAIEDIVNEAVIIEGEDKPVEINLEYLKISDSIKKKITEEFAKILSLMNFNEEGYDLFERWYVDGKIFFHILLDENHSNGIKELRLIDPRKIKKIKNVIKEKLASGVEIVREVQEYYIYNDKGIAGGTSQGVRLSVDSVVYCHSGLIDSQTGLVQSYLHKAIKPANQLKMLEEAVIIYRYTRAPERRVFYIDVGNLPKGKAEQYVSDMMNKFKNKLSYDAVTGELADSKRHLCLDMSTQVPLLDGRTLSISEIAAEMDQSDKPLWAYSCDPVTGKFVPGKITWAGVSRPNAQVMRITLDNGKTITCTPDHKFPVWDKGFVKAEDLYIGESMIPHYTRWKEIAKGSSKNYEQIFENDTGEWKFTHQAVSDWKDCITSRRSSTSCVSSDNSADRQIDSLMFRNHKIAKIEWLEETMDTGCLTIDGDEEFHNYHTFALSAGIYTQNQMMEDFWMPRRGDKSTEITTLPGGQGLGQLDDLDYFKDKLYRSLNVPKSRFVPDSGFSIGRSDTISRDEVKFAKFVGKLRNKFGNIFLDILRVQLISKGIFSSKDWEQFKEKIKVIYAKDNFFAELKENEVLTTRLQTALQLDPFVGKYVSKEYIQRKVLRFTDDEIKEINTQMEAEIKSGDITDPVAMMQEPPQA